MHRDARAATDLDQEVAPARRGGLLTGGRVPRGRILPADQHGLLFVRQWHDGGQVLHLGPRQSTADHHSGALDETLRLHPVLGVLQRQQVGHGVRDHRHPDTTLPVQPGQRVDPIDQAAPGPQYAPELVEDDEVVPPRLQTGIRERLRHRDRPEAVRPAGEQYRRLQAGLGVVDVGHVEDDRAVQLHRLVGLLGEDLP